MASHKSTTPRNAKKTPRADEQSITKIADLLDRLKDGEVVDGIHRQLRKAPPVITEQEMVDGDRRAEEDGYPRRICFGVLKNSGRHMLDQAKTDDGGTALAAMEYAIDGYIESLTLLMAFAREARARVVIALATRTDMDALMAQVRKDSRDESAAASGGAA